MRLPSTITNLILINQPFLKTDYFTIGKYDSNTEKYTNEYKNLQAINIENVPNLNSYEIVKNAESSL